MVSGRPPFALPARRGKWRTGTSRIDTCASRARSSTSAWTATPLLTSVKRFSRLVRTNRNPQFGSRVAMPKHQSQGQPSDSAQDSAIGTVTPVDAVPSDEVILIAPLCEARHVCRVILAIGIQEERKLLRCLVNASTPSTHRCRSFDGFCTIYTVG